MDVKRPIAVAILGALALAAVILVASRSAVAARSYVDCASRVLNGAPPTDSSPPPVFRRLAPELWQKRDLYLARILAAECTSEGRSGVNAARHRLFALGVVKTSLSSSQRESLAAALLPAHGGRGLTRAAQAEWGRPPADLDDSEMTWLFVVGQMPGCSKRVASSEADREFCARLFDDLTARLHRPPSSPERSDPTPSIEADDPVG